MNKRKARTSRHDLWILFAASGVGLIGPLFSHSPRDAIAQDVGGRYASVANPHPRNLGATEMIASARVQLAWLADPVTYPFSLEAIVQGNALEIRGAVPNDSVHEKALSLARAESGMRVIDSIRVGPVASPGRQKVRPDLLAKQAVTQARQALGDRGSAIEVEVWTEGQILLRGQVATLQDKLAASKCLKRVQGCSCVVNELGVRERPRDLEAASTIRPMEAMTSNAADSAAAPGSSRGAALGSAGMSLGRPYMYQTRWRHLEAAPASADVPVAQSVAQESLAIEAAKVPDPTLGVVWIEETEESSAEEPSPFAAMPKTEPAVRQASAAPNDTGSYVTVGEVTFTENEPSELPAKDPMLVILEDRLRQQIATRLGMQDKDVRVVAETAKCIQICIGAHTRGEGEALSAKLFQMPELEPFQVSLDVPLLP